MWYYGEAGEIAASARPNLAHCTLQAMAYKTEDPRCTLIELAEEGSLSWEVIAREFIVFNSSDDVQDVLDTLTDN